MALLDSGTPRLSLRPMLARLGRELRTPGITKGHSVLSAVAERANRRTSTLPLCHVSQRLSPERERLNDAATTGNVDHGAVIVVVVATAATGGSRAVPADDKPRFDVSDISYLWPAPTTQADVDALIRPTQPTRRRTSPSGTRLRSIGCSRS